MKSSKRGFIGIVLLIIIAAVAIGGGGYAYHAKSKNKEVSSKEDSPITTTPPVTNTVTSTKHIEKNSKGFSYDADITETVDCGSADCFNKKFASCEPATLQADIGIGAVAYRILGKTTSGCSLTFKHTNYPDPSWINKEMTCEFDNQVSFEDSLSRVFSGVTNGTVVCKGPLYDILRPR